MVITEHVGTQQPGLSANEVERLITEASHIVTVEEAWTRLNDVLDFYGKIEVLRGEITREELLTLFRDKIEVCWALKHDLNLTLKTKIEEVEEKVREEKEKIAAETGAFEEDFEEDAEDEEPLPETPEIRRLKQVLHQVKKFEQRLQYLERETYLELSNGDGDFRTFRQKIRETSQALMSLLEQKERGAPTRTTMNTAEQITSNGQTIPEVPQAQVEQQVHAKLAEIYVPIVPPRDPGESALAYEDRLDKTLQSLHTEMQKASEADRMVSENYRNIRDIEVFSQLTEAVGAKQTALGAAFSEVIQLQQNPAFLDEKRVEALATSPDRAAETIKALEERVEELEEKMEKELNKILDEVNNILMKHRESQSNYLAATLPDVIRATLAEEFAKLMKSPAEPVKAAEATPLKDVRVEEEEPVLTGTKTDASAPEPAPAQPAAAAAPVAPVTPVEQPAPVIAPEPEMLDFTPPVPRKRSKAEEIREGVTGTLRDIWRSLPGSKGDKAAEQQAASTSTHDTQPSKPVTQTAEKPQPAAATAAPAEPKPAVEAKPATPQAQAKAEPAKPTAESTPAPEKPLPTSLELAKQLNPAWTEADLNAAATKAGPLKDRTKRRIESAIQAKSRLPDEFERLSVLPFIATSNAEEKKLIVQYIEAIKK